MAGISIPGVTDKYNTKDTVEKLMQVERIPLTREQKTLETYKSQQDAWRGVNRKVSTLRDSVKTLYSFENPFNNKLTDSTDENAITADATRSAKYESFKVDVIQEAASDRFLSSELDEDTKVPAGTYTYKVSDKTVSMRWKGGSLKEFSDSLNRRGNNIISSRVIGAAKGKKTISIESLKTGEENKLVFDDDAKTFAETTGMIVKVKPETIVFGNGRNDFRQVHSGKESEQERMPQISSKKIQFSSNAISVPPRNGFSIKVPENVTKGKGKHIYFTVNTEKTDDITDELNSRPSRPEIPSSGTASFRDVTISNSAFDANLPPEPLTPPKPLEKIETADVLFALMKDGSERKIPSENLLKNAENKFDLDISQYEGIDSIVLRNRNTGYSFKVSSFESLNPSENLGFIPQHPVSEAQDAIIKYEGITIKRPENTIDDVVPEVTLNVHGKTEKTATITIKPDTESAKDALITFVGNYNQAMTEINVLSQNKQEIVDEIDYLSEDEKKEEKEKLGMFFSDSTLNTLKNNMQSVSQARYPFSDEAEITMLSQIGISTNASNYNGYSPNKLRGYLEIDEKKLDSELDKHLDEIKNLFGYDSDGDMIVDSGIGYRLDKQLTAYVQTGGIFSLKTSGLDTKIKSSEQKIAKLEDQMEQKEAELKMKYGQMEGALNSLENQSNSISNWSKKSSD